MTRLAMPLAWFAAGALALALVTGTAYLKGRLDCAHAQDAAQARINDMAIGAAGDAAARLARIKGNQEQRLAEFKRALPALVPAKEECTVPAEAVAAYRKAIAP